MLKKGYLTVEAAFIMPVVISLLIVLCCFAFYLHDRNRTRNVCVEACLKGMWLIKREGTTDADTINYLKLLNRSPFYYFFDDMAEKEEAIKNLVMKQLEEGMFLGQCSQVSVALGYDSIKVEATLKFLQPIWAAAGFLEYFDLKIKETIEQPVYNPEEFVRRYTVLDDALDGIDGFKQLKSKIEDFLSKLF